VSTDCGFDLLLGEIFLPAEEEVEVEGMDEEDDDKVDEVESSPINV
jgi:hypothetical protein